MPIVPAGEPAGAVAETMGRRPLAVAGPVWPSLDAEPWLAETFSVQPRRRSVRTFAGKPAPLTALTSALDDGYRTEAALWPAARHGEAEFTVLLAALGIDGLSRGLYHLIQGSEEWRGVPLGEPTWLQELPEEYAPAPAIMLICGDFRSAVTEPATGYGPLLMRASSLAYATWLSALNKGLAGAVFAATMRPATATAKQIDKSLRHLFTLVLGYGRD